MNLLAFDNFTFPAKIVMDKVSDRSKGFGFVTFASEDEAENAITAMNGKVTLNFVSIFMLFVQSSVYNLEVGNDGKSYRH